MKRKISIAFAILLVLSLFASAKVIEVPDATAFMFISEKPPSGSSSVPDWGGEIVRDATASDTSTTVINLTSGISSGDRVVVFANWYATTQTMSSVSDSQSNTYSIDIQHVDGSHHLVIASAHVSTSLTASDSVTVTWASQQYSNRYVTIAYVTGAASTGQPDQTAGTQSYGTSVSNPASTTAQDTICVGFLRMSTSYTYTSDWTISGAAFDNGSKRIYYIYSKESTSGSKDPGGSLSGSDNWWNVWAAYK